MEEWICCGSSREMIAGAEAGVISFGVTRTDVVDSV